MVLFTGLKLLAKQGAVGHDIFQEGWLGRAGKAALMDQNLVLSRNPIGFQVFCVMSLSKVAQLASLHPGHTLVSSAVANSHPPKTHGF